MKVITLKSLLKRILINPDDFESNIDLKLMGFPLSHDVKDIIKYLESGEVWSTLASFEECQICDEEAGVNHYYTDGVWTWPIWVNHYILKHGLKLPTEFIEHIRGSNYSMDREYVQKIANDEDLDFNLV